MRVEGLEAFFAGTMYAKVVPNCLIKRLVEFGKVGFLAFRDGLCPEPWPVKRGLFTKMTQKIKFFENSGKVVFRAKLRR